MAIRDVEFYEKRSIPDAHRILTADTKAAKDVIAGIGPSGPYGANPVQNLSKMGQALLGAKVDALSRKREDAALASLDARETNRKNAMAAAIQASAKPPIAAVPGQAATVEQPGYEAQLAVPPQPGRLGGNDAMIASLLGNDPLTQRDTSDFTQEAILRRNAQRQAAAAADLAWTRKMEGFRTKAEIEAEFKDPEIDKFGTSFVVADPNSSTGFSRQRKNQGGDVDILGEAPAPRALFDPDAQKKAAKFKATSARYDKATDNLNEADVVLADVQSMLDLVGKVDSGSFAETKLAMKKFALAVGFDMDLVGIANAEAMRSKGMDFVLQRIAKTKGAISEKEMKAFKEASAGIENTPEGNRMILALAQKVSARLKFESEAVRDAWGNNPSIDVYDIDNVGINARKEWNKKFDGMSVNAEIVKISNNADFEKFNNDPNIPSGTSFIAPDGSKRFKQ
jgi:hypothetical protein